MSDQPNDGTSEPYVNRRRVLSTVGLAGASLLGVETTSSTPGKPECLPPGQCEPGNSDKSPRPGPAILYEPPATAPQFENTGQWEADSLLVSGTDAYVDGEYLYQDFIYDDHGANTANAPPDPAVSGKTTGDVVYPTNTDTYHNNAADLLEVRASPTEVGVAYRVTLNSMTEPEIAGVAIGINTDEDTATGTDDWGYGIGSLGNLGLDHRIVTWGTGAELDGEPLPDDRVHVDLKRNQIEVEVPLVPGEETWRHYTVAGLFDIEAGQFKPIQNQPSAEQPGGAHGMDAPPVFNVAFRFDEPMGFTNADPETPKRQATEARRSVGTRADPTEHGHWREHAQAKALGIRDISRFHTDIDFGKLAAETTEYAVPQTGYMNRLYSTRHPLGVGTDGDRLLGAVQPYAIYVPNDYTPDEPTPLTIDLHGYTDSHNALGVRTPNKARQMGEERGHILLSPLGRGVGLFYHDASELDVFETLADVAGQYNVDFDRLTINGHSMGGYGTLKLASQYPDLFARAFVTAAATDGSLFGYPFDVTTINDNLRHIPLRWWQGSNDPIVQASTAVQYEQQLRDHDYRHELDIFTGYSHNTFHHRDQWGPAADFLLDVSRTEHPPQVTYRVVPSLHNSELDLVSNKAYWVSDIEVADGAATGLVDIRSLAFGEADPIPADYRGSGTDPDPHVKRGTRWKEPLANPLVRNTLELSLESVTWLTVWVEDAGLDPERPITLSADTTTAATVELVSDRSSKTASFPPGSTERTVELDAGERDR